MGTASLEAHACTALCRSRLPKCLRGWGGHRGWGPAVWCETGGRPSSHSALVTGTAAAIAFEQGLDSPLFALAATVAFVVMYDASGVRRAAGRIAERLNSLAECQGQPPLKTSLGHSRLEVLVGSLIGPLVALPGLALLGSPLQLAQRLGSWLVHRP